jgi:hypothetical protein
VQANVDMPIQNLNKIQPVVFKTKNVLAWTDKLIGMIYPL